MRDEVARDLSDSAYDFKRVVWPAIEPWCQGGSIEPVEAVSPGQFEKQLDVLAGIDAWQIVENTGIRGICSRIQWCKDGRDGSPKWFETFTIRRSRPSGASTEWEKRTKALNGKGGFIRPALIVHAYIRPPRRGGELNYVCMCYADDLFALATEEMRGKVWYSRINPTDGVEFAAFDVHRMLEHGVKVKTFCPARGEVA